MSLALMCVIFWKWYVQKHFQRTKHHLNTAQFYEKKYGTFLWFPSLTDGIINNYSLSKNLKVNLCEDTKMTSKFRNKCSTTLSYHLKPVGMLLSKTRNKCLEEVTKGYPGTLLIGIQVV